MAKRTGLTTPCTTSGRAQCGEVGAQTEDNAVHEPHTQRGEVGAQAEDNVEQDDTKTHKDPSPNERSVILSPHETTKFGARHKTATKAFKQ